LGTAEDRKLEPKNEEGLEGEVPGEVVKDDTECKAFKEIEEAEDDPIGEPLYVVLRASRLECLE